MVKWDGNMLSGVFSFFSFLTLHGNGVRASLHIYKYIYVKIMKLTTTWDGLKSPNSVNNKIKDTTCPHMYHIRE